MRLLLPLWVYRVRPIRALIAVTAWKWFEGETTEQGDTYGSPSYGFGKVTDLYPDVRVMTETTESPYVCCAYCSAGMVCRTVKAGLSSKMNSTAHPIRTKGGRPHNNGANATEVRNGTKLAHGITLDAVAVSEIITRLKKGYAVEIACDYAELPAYLKVQSNNFGHSVMLFGHKVSNGADMVGFFDPLWPQDARGAWAKWTDIKPALWSDGNHNAARSVLQPPTPPTPPDPEPPSQPAPPVEPTEPESGPECQPDPSEAVRTDRDRAWREETGTDRNPVHVGRWDVIRWSRFGRWTPVPPLGTWSHAAFDVDRWERTPTPPPEPKPPAYWS